MVLSAVLACGLGAAVYFQRQASELERQHAAMLTAMGEEYGALTELLNGSDYGFAILDSDERVVKWNAALERWTGYMAADTIGNRITFMMAPDAAARHHDAFVKTINDPTAAGKTQIVNCTLVAKDGIEIPVQVSVRVVYPRDGRSAYAVASIDQQRRVVEVNGRQKK